MSIFYFFIFFVAHLFLIQIKKAGTMSSWRNDDIIGNFFVHSMYYKYHFIITHIFYINVNSNVVHYKTTSSWWNLPVMWLRNWLVTGISSWQQYKSRRLCIAIILIAAPVDMGVTWLYTTHRLQLLVFYYTLSKKVHGYL